MCFKTRCGFIGISHLCAYINAGLKFIIPKEGKKCRITFVFPKKKGEKMANEVVSYIYPTLAESAWDIIYLDRKISLFNHTYIEIGGKSYYRWTLLFYKTFDAKNLAYNRDELLIKKLSFWVCI